MSSLYILVINLLLDIGIPCFIVLCCITLTDIGFGFFFFFNFVYLFFGCVGSLLLHAGFLCLRRAGATLHCFSLWWLLLVSTGSRCTGFSSWGAQPQQLWHTGLAAPWHVGSSRTRDRTHVPCIGRRILNHCTTREVPRISFWSDENVLKLTVVMVTYTCIY